MSAKPRPVWRGRLQSSTPRYAGCTAPSAHRGRGDLPLFSTLPLRAGCPPKPALSGGVASTHQHPAMPGAPRLLPIAGGDLPLLSTLPIGLGLCQTPPCLAGSPLLINTPLCGVHHASCPSRAGVYNFCLFVIKLKMFQVFEELSAGIEFFKGLKLLGPTTLLPSTRNLTEAKEAKFCRHDVITFSMTSVMMPRYRPCLFSEVPSIQHS